MQLRAYATLRGPLLRQGPVRSIPVASELHSDYSAIYQPDIMSRVCFLASLDMILTIWITDICLYAKINNLYDMV